MAPGDARGPAGSARAQSSSHATTPPSTSPCPPMYLVAEWSESATPWSSGRCSTGVAKVLSISTGTSPAAATTAREVDELERRVAGRLGHHEPGVGPHERGGDLVDAVDERGLGAEQAAREQVVGAAVERSHRHDVAAAPLPAAVSTAVVAAMPDGERDRGLGALELREGALEPRDGRVPEPLVDGGWPSERSPPVAADLVGVAAGIDPRQRVGGGEVDRGRVHAQRLRSSRPACTASESRPEASVIARRHASTMPQTPASGAMAVRRARRDASGC